LSGKRTPRSSTTGTSSTVSSSSARPASTAHPAVVFGTLGLAVFWLTFRSDWHLVSGGGPLSTALLVGMLSAVAFWVLRLTIVVLLWRRESSSYFAAKAAGW
jgi:hypothetical protein